MLEILEDSRRKIITKTSKKYKHKKVRQTRSVASPLHAPNQTVGLICIFFPENKLFQFNNWAKIQEARQNPKVLLVINSIRQWDDFCMK